MASAAPSGAGGSGGDDKPPESAPGSLVPPARPKRSERRVPAAPAPAPSSGDTDPSAIETAGISDPQREEGGMKWSCSSCRVCTLRTMILDGIDPRLLSDDELAALPPAPVPGMGAGALGTKGSPSKSRPCRMREFRKKILRDSRLRRNSEVPTPLRRPPPKRFYTTTLGDKWRLSLDQEVRAQAQARRLALEQVQARRRGKKRPLSVQQERGYGECDVGKKSGPAHRPGQWGACPGPPDTP